MRAKFQRIAKKLIIIYKFFRKKDFAMEVEKIENINQFSEIPLIIKEKINKNFEYKEENLKNMKNIENHSDFTNESTNDAISQESEIVDNYKNKKQIKIVPNNKTIKEIISDKKNGIPHKFKVIFL